MDFVTVFVCVNAQRGSKDTRRNYFSNNEEATTLSPLSISS